MTHTSVVGDDHAGVRLDAALAELLGCSRSRAAARIDAGLVRLDGATAVRSARLRAGQRLEVDDVPVEASAPPPPLPDVRYRDEHLLVVAKPPDLVVHPGHGRPDGTLVDALRAADVPLADVGDPARPGIVHRLDRDTSGLLVVASTAAAHAGLVAALAERRVTRRYVGLVAGVPAAPRGRIEAPIGRDPRERTRFAVVTDGREAVTRYATEASGEVPGLPPGRREVSVLRCRLETGRTHQIRVHLTTLGHPLVGDRVYGPRGDLAAALGLTRPALHAGRLAFTHPVTGAEVDVVEPLPDDLAAALERAGLPVPDLTSDLDV
jgi:23S rRNA pseudouridine1911/1915/1917 synthase